MRWLAGLLVAGLLAPALVAAALVATEDGLDRGDVEALSGVDAVVALVGTSGRLAAAEAVRDHTGGALVISARPPDHEDHGGRRAARCAAADGRDVVCFQPEPHATRGEARAVGELVAERGWDRVVVVTSRYHLRRAGLLVRQCAPDAEVTLVASSDALPVGSVLREVLALGAAITVHRAC